MSDHADLSAADGAPSGRSEPGLLEPAELEGAVDRIVYQSPETHYTIATLRTGGSKVGNVTIVGSLAGVRPEDVLRVRGAYIHDKKYGRQFKVESYTPVMPSDVVAMERYLASGLVKGIGPVYAKRLVAHFGEKLFEVLDAAPERVGEVEGIGPKRVELIRKSWHDHRVMRNIIMFLQKHGIPQSFAGRIFRQYGEDSIEQIMRNPYQLAVDVRGIGFQSADGIAQKLGIPTESLERCKAGLLYFLQQQAALGHVFADADSLITQAAADLKVEEDLVTQAINALRSEQHIVAEILPSEQRAVFLASLHHQETSIAESLLRLMTTAKLLPKIDGDAQLAAFENRHRFALAAQQRQAVMTALHGGVLVITGGPGTGKTTIIRTILSLFMQHGVSVLLAAPTGRAAKRMTELSGQPASTIHRLLQAAPGSGYQRNAMNPISCDVLIVDEASMLDVPLTCALLKAVPNSASVIFVGDIDQLPSVGPGQVLGDCLASGVVPVVRLTEVFRQAEQSLIVTNAHRINGGKYPLLPPKDAEKPADFYIVECETPEAGLDRIREMVARRIPSRYGMDPLTDVQVLCPMHRGVLGARNLNAELQALLNGTGPGVERTGTMFRTGDKVMQVENDYEKDVFNGDIGRIVMIDREEQAVRISFDGRIVTYEFSELYEIELAYAISIHKSQGSEYRAVVIPMHTTHYVMLGRNLLYTAVTRGKELVVLVGQRRAIEMALRNTDGMKRNSALDQRLRVLAERAGHSLKNAQ